MWGGVGGRGNLSPPRLNIFTMGNMGVMICLGKGGLRSLSASSYICYHCSFPGLSPQIERIILISYHNDDKAGP